MVFFNFTLVAKVSVSISQVVVASCYITMVFTVNLFSSVQVTLQ